MATPTRVRTTAALVAPLAAAGMALEFWSWDKFATAPALPIATWVLTDFDRIHTWYWEIAAERRQALLAGGASVLNDPTRFLTRVPYLRRLRAAGINSFDCWQPVNAEVPTRFPVFLRTAAAHRGTYSDLLPDADAAQMALNRALDEGIPLADLVFIEYRAAPSAATGHFQKLAAYRIGDQILRAFTVNDTSWHAKNGVLGLSAEADYAAELAEFSDYPHADLIRRVTDIAGVTFCRVDFAMVNGRPEIYEVNSNPYLGFPDDHPSPSRAAAAGINRAAMVAAFDRITPAAPDGAPDLLDMTAQRKWPRLSP